MSIVQRDKVLSSYNGNIESILLTNDVETYTNGVFVTLGGLADKGREVKKATLATDATEDVLLVSSPEVMYEAGKQIDDFVNEKGEVARAFRLADGDVITLTNDLITGLAQDADAVAGDVYLVDADGKLKKKATSPKELDDTAKANFVVRESAGYELTRKQKATRFDVVK